MSEALGEFIRGNMFSASLTPKSIPHRAVKIDVVTQIPANPQDGDEFYYVASSTSGVMWRFRYQQGDSTYPWWFVGGAPLVNEVSTSETTTSASYTDLATAGPSVTVPFAGDYDVYTSCELSGTNAAGLMSYSIGSTAAVDADMIISSISNEAQTMSVSRVKRQSGLTASTALVSKYRTSGVAVSFLRRVIGVTPVRIGG